VACCLSGICSFFLFKRDFRLKKRSNALRVGPRRFAARAVKAAAFAFIEAKWRALTEQAGGEAHSCGRKGTEIGRFSWRVSDFGESDLHHNAGHRELSILVSAMSLIQDLWN
jgi:hypothetical protein